MQNEIANNLTQLRAELDTLTDDPFTLMQYNIKVLTLLGPGDHWLLRKVPELININLCPVTGQKGPDANNKR